MLMKRFWIVMGLVVAGYGIFGLAQNPQPVPPAFEKSATTQDDPDAPIPSDLHVCERRMVRAQVEFIELSHEALTKLLFLDAPQRADATPLRKQLQETVAKHDAKVLDTQIIVARSGGKATSESLHEFIYPTEYEPPGLPCGGPGTPEKSSSSMPTAFETRHLGSTIEIEPTFGSDENIIDLRVTTELVWHTGDTVWGEGKDALGMPFRISMPDIYTMRLNTAISCINGQYTLVGTVSPKDAKGDTDLTRKVMVFVKCDILTVK